MKYFAEHVVCDHYRKQPSASFNLSKKKKFKIVNEAVTPHTT